MEGKEGNTKLNLPFKSESKLNILSNIQKLKNKGYKKHTSSREKISPERRRNGMQEIKESKEIGKNMFINL